MRSRRCLRGRPCLQALQKELQPVQLQLQLPMQIPTTMCWPLQTCLPSGLQVMMRIRPLVAVLQLREARLLTSRRDWRQHSPLQLRLQLLALVVLGQRSDAAVWKR